MPVASSVVGFSMTPSSDLVALKKDFSKRYLSGKEVLAQKATLFGGAPVPDPTTNVVGVGVGEKNALDQPTGIMAIRFFVRQKIPDNYLNDNNRLPKSIDGLPTDVEEIGIVRAFAKKKAAAVVVAAAAMPNPRTKMRPAHPGCSVGFQLPAALMAGTFGAVVKDKSGKIYILSNNHVLANENRLPIGDPIFQPGLLDSGNPATDQIAKLSKFEPLDPVGANEVDCAIAGVLNKADVSRDVLFIGPPTGVAPARIDTVVHKFGRTTDYTVGIITSINTDVTVGYDIGSLFFSEQIIIRSLNAQPFSMAGDSGSLILERQTNKATGLLFAGSASHTIANHIEKALDALKVKLV